MTDVKMKLHLCKEPDKFHLSRCCKIWNQEKIRVINNLMYIELKTGYSDDDPAWIGYVKTSKSRIKIF